MAHHFEYYSDWLMGMPLRWFGAKKGLNDLPWNDAVTHPLYKYLRKLLKPDLQRPKDASPPSICP